MYLTIAILAGLFFLILFSQFGSRLSARHTLVWWSVALFILTAALWPEFFQGVAHRLGVTLASNLVFSGLILLLIFLFVEQGVEITRDRRLIREMATEETARHFMEIHQPQWPDKTGPKVLVILPAFNEEGNVALLSRQLQDLTQKTAYPLFFCFIDDGSMDGTGEILQTLVPGHLATHGLNLGVSSALLTGMKIAERCRADYVVQCDADGQHPVELIPPLIDHALSRKSDLLIGSRYKTGGTGLIPKEEGSRGDSSTYWRRLGSRCIALALRGFGLPEKITDPTSGFRIYSRSAVKYLIRRMPEEYPEPETIALLAWANLKIHEVNTPMAARRGGVSTIRGLRSLRYMTKVLGALMGLRLRILFSQFQ